MNHTLRHGYVFVTFFCLVNIHVMLHVFTSYAMEYVLFKRVVHAMNLPANRLAFRINVIEKMWVLLSC